MPEHHGKPAHTGDVSGEVKSDLVTLTMSHGETSDGVTFKRATYYYHTITDFSLCVCAVLFDGDATYRFDPTAAGSDTFAAGIAANNASVYGPGVNPSVAAGLVGSPAVCTHVQAENSSTDPFRLRYVASSTYTLSAASFEHPCAKSRQTKWKWGVGFGDSFLISPAQPITPPPTHTHTHTHAPR